MGRYNFRNFGRVWVSEEKRWSRSRRFPVHTLYYTPLLILTIRSPVLGARCTGALCVTSLHVTVKLKSAPQVYCRSKRKLTRFLLLICRMAGTGAFYQRLCLSVGPVQSVMLTDMLDTPLPPPKCSPGLFSSLTHRRTP